MHLIHLCAAFGCCLKHRRPAALFLHWLLSQVLAQGIPSLPAIIAP